MASKGESMDRTGTKIDLKEEDIFAAMREIPGYLDITPGDFKEIYALAFQHALERLNREVTVAEIMSTEVVGVKESQNFMTLVASCLRSKGCVALPVKKQNAGDLMSKPAVTVRPETRVRDLAELLASRHINRAPVTDADGYLVGIVTRGDLVKATLAGGRP